MQIKILKYIPDPYGDFRLGYAVADVSAKMKLVLTVATKEGKIFCTFPRTKVAGQWMPMFEMSMEVMREITDAATVQIQSIVGTAKVAPPPPDDDGDIPF